MSPPRPRRRVLVVTTWFPSDLHPTEAPFTLAHVDAIRVRHEVEVIHVRLNSTAVQGSGTYGGVPVRRLSFDPRRPWSGIAILNTVRRAAAASDVLHTMAFSSVLVCLPAMIGARLPWVHTEHWNGVVNPASVSPLWRRMAWLRWVLRRPSWLTGVTTQLTEVLGRFGNPTTSSVVPCVVDNPRPVVAPTVGGPLRLIAIGGLVPRKRPMLALRTVEWLTKQGHDVTLTWVGDGPQRAAVVAAAAKAGLSSRFILVGPVAPREVFARYEAADLFFLPTEQENFFTSAAEALSAGRPVVAARVGGFDDYADGSNSVLIDDPTPENFGRAILAAAEEFADVDASTIAAPIRERFSVERISAQFDDIYTRVSPTGRSR